MTNNIFNSNDRLLDIAGLIADLLPSGSGFNGRWRVQQKGDTFTCYQSYLCMTECGTDDGYAEFKLKLKLVDGELHVIGWYWLDDRSRYLAKKYDLNGYFDSVFFEFIHDDIRYYATSETILHNL